MKKRIILSLLVLCFGVILFGVITANAATYGNYTYTVSNGEVTIKDCDTSVSGAITIPSRINGYPVTIIGNYAFENCTGLTIVKIPDSVTIIGNYAFKKCTGLTSVEIPDSVTRTGTATFEGCTGLTSLEIPDSVTIIGGFAFCGCTGLTSLEIPDSVTIIDGFAFCGCTGLTSVEIPDSVTSIEGGAFKGCTGLTSVEIPDSVTSIGQWAFENCTGLTSVEIPDSVTSIDNYAFRNTAYYNNANNWENEVLYIGNHLVEAKTSLTGDYSIRQGVITVASCAFQGCTGLTSVEIPDSVTSIGYRAFQGCTGLTSVTIGNSVTNIGSFAFYECSLLCDVYYNGTECEWNKITIDSSNTNLSNATKYFRIKYQFVDEDGTVILEKTVDYGTKIELPENPADKDPYTFDYWQGYTEGMTGTKNVTFTAVYKYKDYAITVDGVSTSITVTYNDRFVIEPVEKKDYIFYGYFTEKNGQGTKITDENGNSIEPYNYTENITVYPYYDSELLNKIQIDGTSEVYIGEKNIDQAISFATDKEIMYLVATVKFSGELKLTEVKAKDFVEVYEDSRITENGYTTVTFTTLYDYEGNFAPINEELNPFDLVFAASTDLKAGEICIEITDALMIGEGEYEFDEKGSKTITVLPKLAESIEIAGNDEIDKPTEYTAVVLPDYTSNKTVEWSVDDETVATISADGVLIPVKNGSVTITATAKDGSGVFATKTVNVIAYAKINTLISDVGTWNKTFEAETREYVVYVKDDDTSIVLTPTFSGGVLRPNGSGIWISNAVKSFTLSEDTTVITLNRQNVTDMTNSEYKITVIKTEKSNICVSSDRKTVDIITVGADRGTTVILALYKGNRFAGMEKAIYDGQRIIFETEVDYDFAKVMVWGDMETFVPVTAAEDVEI